MFQRWVSSVRVKDAVHASQLDLQGSTVSVPARVRAGETHGAEWGRGEAGHEDRREDGQVQDSLLQS